MPAAHKRRLPWPTPDDSEGRVAARHTAAASGDGGRGGGGASHDKDGEASARQGSPPHPGPRDGGEMINDAAPPRGASVSRLARRPRSMPWVVDVSDERFRLCLGGFADPDDKEVGGGCGGGDGTDTDGESSLSPSAGSMEE